MKYWILILIILSACAIKPIAEKNNQISIPNTEQIQKNGDQMTIVKFVTTQGNFSAEIYTKEAPITSTNFISLVNSGFYNGLTFHRYEPRFVIQGGDPKGDGTGGSGKKIPLEIVPSLKHDLGALSMARTDDPNSATSQFFVVIGEAHFLDGNYAVFGKVTSGMDTVMKIRKGDKMLNVSVE